MIDISQNLIYTENLMEIEKKKFEGFGELRTVEIEEAEGAPVYAIKSTQELS